MKRRKKERGNTECDAFKTHNLWSIMKVHTLATCGFLKTHDSSSFFFSFYLRRSRQVLERLELLMWRWWTDGFEMQRVLNITWIFFGVRSLLSQKRFLLSVFCGIRFKYFKYDFLRTSLLHYYCIHVPFSAAGLWTNYVLKTFKK